MTQDEETVLGEEVCYCGLMKHRDHFLRSGKCKFKDNKWHTLCTHKHFSNIYEAAYESMVKCGMTETLHSSIMYDKEGNEVDDPKLMQGKPSMYQLTKPGNCLFVDET